MLAAVDDGFDVYFVSDCWGGVTTETHDDAKARMMLAGAKPINRMTVAGEWAPEYTSPERAVLTDVYLQRNGAPALVTEYVMAEVAAGLVSLPGFMSAPDQAGALGAHLPNGASAAA